MEPSICNARFEFCAFETLIYRPHNCFDWHVILNILWQLHSRETPLNTRNIGFLGLSLQCATPLIMFPHHTLTVTFSRDPNPTLNVGLLGESFDVPCSSNIIEDSHFVLKTHQILVLFHFLDRHATLTIFWQPYPHRNLVRSNILVKWDCFLDVLRPYRLGTRFAFCAEDKLLYSSFLRWAYYPHHTFTVLPPPHTQNAGPWDEVFDVQRPTYFGARFEYCA